MRTLLTSQLYFERILGLFQKFHGVSFRIVPVKRNDEALRLIMYDPRNRNRQASVDISKRMYWYLNKDMNETIDKMIKYLHQMKDAIYSHK